MQQNRCSCSGFPSPTQKQEQWLLIPFFIKKEVVVEAAQERPSPQKLLQMVSAQSLRGEPLYWFHLPTLAVESLAEVELLYFDHL